MINLRTLLSSFDEKGTLLKWLKKVEAALANASLDTIQLVTIDTTHIKLKFVFADGSYIESPVITLSQGGEGGITLEELLAKLEGSDYISVDLNDGETKIRIELDETMLDDEPTEDSENLVKSGGVYDALAGKLEASKNAVSTVGGLVTPTQAPSVVEIVGIDSTGAQVRIQVDTNDFEIDGTTSPYTLKKKAEEQGETWVINENFERLSSGTSFNINFTSNDIDFNSINFVSQQAGPQTVTVLDYDNTNVWFAGWTSQDYRTLYFPIAPTGELRTWLQANGMKQ